MIHISIEGMDGVGKSTVCNMLAQKLNYKFVEKPLHYLFDEEEGNFTNYIKIRNKVNANPNRDFTALFYGLGSMYMYEKFKDQNIITDRHLVSNYAWSGNGQNDDVYDFLIKKLGKPALIVILYAPSTVIEKRLVSRCKTDSDLKKVGQSEQIYKKMIDFCMKKGLPHLVIDTSNLTPEEITEKIISKVWYELWKK